MVIAVTDTTIDEDTMMVSFGDAITAYTAVLGSSRLSLPTCFTNVAWNKKVVIVRIETAVYVEVLLEDIAWVHGS
jgi:hypothetical protein